MITIKDLAKILIVIWFMYLLLKSVILADFKAIDWNNYKGYWSSWKYFITEWTKPIKVISFSKQTITGENCNTNSVVSPVCTPDIDLIDLIQKQLENFKNSCISNTDKADIIYIKGKTKYINTFRLAPTWAL